MSFSHTGITRGSRKEPFAFRANSRSAQERKKMAKINTEYFEEERQYGCGDDRMILQSESYHHFALAKGSLGKGLATIGVEDLGGGCCRMVLQNTYNFPVVIRVKKGSDVVPLRVEAGGWEKLVSDEDAKWLLELLAQAEIYASRH